MSPAPGSEPVPGGYRPGMADTPQHPRIGGTIPDDWVPVTSSNPAPSRFVPPTRPQPTPAEPPTPVDDGLIGVRTQTEVEQLRDDARPGARTRLDMFSGPDERIARDGITAATRWLLGERPVTPIGNLQQDEPPTRGQIGRETLHAKDAMYGLGPHAADRHEDYSAGVLRTLQWVRGHYQRPIIDPRNPPRAGVRLVDDVRDVARDVSDQENRGPYGGGVLGTLWWAVGDRDFSPVVGPESHGRPVSLDALVAEARAAAADPPVPRRSRPLLPEELHGIRAALAWLTGETDRVPWPRPVGP